MSLYAGYGYTDFVVACGYKGEIIREYFESSTSELKDWRVRLEDTGADTLTGGRLLRLRDTLRHDTFMVTYGDGLSSISIADLVAFHRSHGKLATVTAVHPPARFGEMEIHGNCVAQFSEKPQTRVGWINGGFFVFKREFFDVAEKYGDVMLEREPMDDLVSRGELAAYRHEGFWEPMDTMREYRMLNGLWASGEAPWKVW